MKRKYIVELSYVAMQLGKQDVRRILWEKIDKELFREFGNDIYTWYEIEMTYSKMDKNNSTQGKTFYVIVEITPIESLWKELKEVEERLKVGL